MTIDVNFRVVLKKDNSFIGTVVEVKQIGKLKSYKIAWDRRSKNNDHLLLKEIFHKASDIIELYRLKTLNVNERNLLIQQRNKIVDSNLVKSWKLSSMALNRQLLKSKCCGEADSDNNTDGADSNNNTDDNSTCVTADDHVDFNYYHFSEDNAGAAVSDEFHSVYDDEPRTKEYQQTKEEEVKPLLQLTLRPTTYIVGYPPTIAPPNYAKDYLLNDIISCPVTTNSSTSKYEVHEFCKIRNVSIDKSTLVQRPAVCTQQSSISVSRAGTAHLVDEEDIDDFEDNDDDDSSVDTITFEVKRW
jgi:hypothetical protein